MSAPWHVWVPGVLGGHELAALLAVADAVGWTPVDEGDAPVIGPAGYQSLGGRRQLRAAIDDEPLAMAIWAPLRARLPPLPCAEPIGINPRLRFYAYPPGAAYPPHTDGAWIVGGARRSALTLLLYLNDGFGGGETSFLDDPAPLTPRAGAALIFPHERWHQGHPVTSGTKLILRTDLLCPPVPGAEAVPNRPTGR